MKFSPRFALLAALVSLVAVACTAGTESAADTAATSQSLLERCVGNVECAPAGQLATLGQVSTMYARGNACMVQGSALLPGGSVEGDPKASWNEGAGKLRVCQGANCFECQRPGGPSGTGSTPKPKEKSCKGSPDSCPSSPPCATIRGCYMATRYRYDYNHNPIAYFECTGSASSCDDMGDEGSCRSQGCQWR